MTSFVYFIQRGEAGPIKIGRSGNPKARLAALQTASDQPLRIIGVMEGSKQTELALHRRFASDRLEGEWFSPTEEIIAQAAACQSPPVADVAPAADPDKAFNEFKARWAGNSSGMFEHLALNLPSSTFGRIMELTAEKLKEIAALRGQP